MRQYLFVYGTLRAGAGRPLYRLLQQYGRRIGAARYAGRLYDLGSYPGVVPNPGGPAIVQGELHELLRPEVVLPLLDRYEGCTEGDAARPEYRRIPQRVVRADGTAVEAWVYLYNWPIGALRSIAGGDFLHR